MEFDEWLKTDQGQKCADMLTLVVLGENSRDELLTRLRTCWTDAQCED